ncbi:hypothetical protein [Chitinophaga vietnamensis]|uniref:hypothetical protein n=1 Tax=Chitinophaga vietnamensis TaxID=2593957 RepID=UPI0011785330|nr:hypothetical protein [Chitinophaga vietnamensis]
MRAVCFAALACLLVLSACKFRQKTDPIEKPLKETLEEAATQPGMNAGTGLVSIDIPQGWNRTDTVMNGVNFVYVLGPNFHVGQASATIITQALTNGASFDSYFEMNRSGLENGQRVVRVDDSVRELNGDPVKGLTMTRDINGTTVRTAQYFVLHDNIVYIVTFGAPEQHFHKCVKDFDHIFNSIKF